MAKKITQLPFITSVDINNDVIPIVDVSDTTGGATGTTKKIHPDDLGIALGLQNYALIAAQPGLAMPITFIKDSVYGSIDTPLAGNITADVVGAQLMVTNLILHQDTGEPSYPASFVHISGTYDPAKVNRILCTYIDDNTIDYSISQPSA